MAGAAVAGEIGGGMAVGAIVESTGGITAADAKAKLSNLKPELEESKKGFNKLNTGCALIHKLLA